MVLMNSGSRIESFGIIRPRLIPSCRMRHERNRKRDSGLLGKLVCPRGFLGFAGRLPLLLRDVADRGDAARELTMSVYTCERCGADAPFICNDCYRESLDKLLASSEWRDFASRRPGDRPGESFLAMIARERAALCRGGGVEGAQARLRAGR